jgi:hypothetical protein
VVKLALGAESWLSITERLIEALPHVRMGPVETDDGQGLRLLSGTGAKGMGESGPSPFVLWVRVGMADGGLIGKTGNLSRGSAALTGMM